LISAPKTITFAIRYSHTNRSAGAPNAWSAITFFENRR